MPTIADVRALADPARSFQFQVLIAPLIGTGSDTGTMSLRCQSTQVPGVQNEATMVRLAGFRLPYPGLQRFSHVWPTRFVEGNDMGVFQQIQSWATTATDPTTQLSGTKLSITANATVQQLDNGGNAIQSWLIVGVWPSIVPGYAMDVDSSNPVEFSVDWYFDYWQPGTQLGTLT